MRKALVGLAVLTAASLQSASAGAQDEEEEILIVKRVTREEIVVTGRGLPKCARRPGDPLDQVDASGLPPGAQTMIVRDPATGQIRFAADTDPIGGDEWQRAGRALSDYVFRAPEDGTPLCIGSRASRARGFGQLRRIVDATPFHGRGVRLSGYIATNRHGRVRLWLVAGLKQRGVIAGNDTPQAALSKKTGWKPFALEIPYVPDEAWSISYGFLLEGGGDVWVHDLKVEPLPAGSAKDRELRATPIG